MSFGVCHSSFGIIIDGCSDHWPECGKLAADSALYFWHQTEKTAKLDNGPFNGCDKMMQSRHFFGSSLL
jgi:hypothetical protein